MLLTLQLNNLWKRVALLGVILTGAGGLVFVVLSHFVINTISDDGYVVLRSTLASAAAYFPDSSRLQVRLAKVELTEAAEEADVLRAEAAALSAVKLSPWSSNNQLLLASVRNLQGDLGATETAMRAAVKLAPNSSQAHWQLANLLIRQDKLDEAIKEFQLAIASDAGSVLLPGTMDLVWNVSEGNVEKLTQVVGTNPKNRLQLAQYLLKQSRLSEAVAIYKSVERPILLESPAATEFLNSLVTSGQLDLARDLWGHLVAAGKSADGQALYNGGFEKELVPSLSQFDWKVTHSEYAILNLDSAVAHSGKRSLRLNLTGRDTTVLGKEFNQTVVVKPGARYRLECFAKTDKLVTSEPVHIVVTEMASSTPLGTSTPITAGSRDWQSHTLDFVASTKSKAVVVTIKRTPRFSYDEPSRGTIWLDDFTLREVGQSK